LSAIFYIFCSTFATLPFTDACLSIFPLSPLAAVEAPLINGLLLALFIFSYYYFSALSYFLGSLR
jgi:hypothetical protein